MSGSYKKWTPPPKVERVGFKPSFSPSDAQAAIFRAVKLDHANVHCSAVAGSGKSTTLKWLAMLTDEMWKVQKKRGEGRLVAFNSDIVRSIEPYLPESFLPVTLHALGRSVIASNVRKVQRPDTYKVLNILDEVSKELNPTKASAADRGKAFRFRKSVQELIDKLRVTRRDYRNADVVRDTVAEYMIELDDKQMSIVLEILPTVFKEIIHQGTAGIIDFADMLWLPLEMGWKFPTFQSLMVDEAQDLNQAAIEMCKAIHPEQFVSVGDRWQSINGFSGSNPRSIDVLIEAFGSRELPLSVCYRCGKKIVEEAQTIVPDIQAYEGSPDGEVIKHWEPGKDEIQYLPGDMVLARRNATLVRPAFRLLKQGKLAIIKGRDIGENFVSLISEFDTDSIPSLLDQVDGWRSKKIENLSKRSRPSDAQIMIVEDTADALSAMAEECSSIEDLKAKINKIFSNDGTPGVTFSSAHRSKGLESDRVIILEAHKIRMQREGMSQDQVQQEKNLDYVSTTRAKKTLVKIYYEQ